MIIKKTIPVMGITVLLLLVNIPLAEANLIGDIMHVLVVNNSQVLTLCDEDVLVVDPGVELTTCMLSTEISIDINGDSIWFVSNTILPDGFLVGNLEYDFTDMDWVNPGPGIITGVELFGITTVPSFTLSHTTDSVHFEHDEITLDCGGQTECPLEFHIDIDTEHDDRQAIGGEFVPMSTSALLLAGAQNSMAWMIPLMVAVAGFGLVISRKL